MKKIYTLAALMLALSAVSCQKTETPVVEDGLNLVPFTISAAAEDAKVTLKEGAKTYWTNGDEISLCYCTPTTSGNSIEKGAKLTTTLAASSPVADFTGEVPAGLTNYYAIYPFNRVDHWNRGGGRGQVYVTINNNQTAIKGNISASSHVLYAHATAEEPTLKFKVFTAYLKIKIDAESPAVKSIKVLNGSGQAYGLNLEAENAPQVDTYGLRDVVFSAPGESLEQGDYYIAVYPHTHADGLTLEVTKADGTTFTVSKSGKVDLNRGTIYKLGAVREKITAPVEDPFKVGDVIDGEGVVFAVADGGATAKIVEFGRTQLHWTEFTDKTNATDKNNGMNNHATVKTYLEANDKTLADDAPAFYYCESKGEGWYLPAQNEFHDLLVAYDGTSSWTESMDATHRLNIESVTAAQKAAREAFDKKLTDNGGVAMNGTATSGTGEQYWTSTEMTGTTSSGKDKTTCAWMIRVGKFYECDGDDAASKTKNGYVRCIKQITR